MTVQNFLYQSLFDIPPPPIGPRPMSEGMSVQIKAPIPAAQQQFSGLASQRIVLPTFGFSQAPDRFASALPSAQQQFAGFVPSLQSLAVNANIGGAESAVVRRVVVVAHNMQWPAQVVVVAQPSLGLSQAPEKFNPPFASSLQQFSGFQPQGAIVAITPQGFRDDLSVQVARPFASPQQQFAGWPVQAIAAPISFVFGQTPDPFRFSARVFDFSALVEVPPFVAPSVFDQLSLQIARTLASASQQFTGWSTPPAVAPTAVFDQLSARITVPWPAAQQRFADFAPAGSIVSITPQGFRDDLSVQISRLFAATQQQFSGWPAQPVVAVQPTLGLSQSPERFTPPFASSRQQFTGFQPQGAVVSVTPQGFRDDISVQIARLFASAQQQFAGWPAQPIVLPAFGFSQSPERFTPLFASAGQQFSGFQALGTVISLTPQGFRDDLSVQIAKTLAASQQQFSGLASQRVVLPTFGFIQAPERFAMPLAGAQQQFAGWPSQAFAPVAVLPVFDQLSVRISQPWPAMQQQFTASFGYLAPSAFVPWAQMPWPERFAPSVATAQQQFVGWPAQFISVAPTPIALGLSESPIQIARVLAAAQQQFSGLAPQLLLTPAAVGPTYDSTVFSDHVTIVAFSSFAPAGAIFSITPQGFRDDLSAQIARSFQASLQQFGEFAPRGAIVEPAPVRGWRGDDLSIQIARGFGVPLQQFGGFQPQGAIISSTPQGGYSELWWRSRVPMEPKLQQFAALQPQGAIVSITPQGGYSDLPRRTFREPMPAAAQQFSGWSAQIIIPAPPPRFATKIIVVNSVIDTTFGSIPNVGEAATLKMFTGPGLQLGAGAQLQFIRPDGTLAIADFRYVFIGTIPSVEINGQVFLAGQYVIYTFAPGELNEFGTWQAQVVAPGGFMSTVGHFTVGGKITTVTLRPAPIPPFIPAEAMFDLWPPQLSRPFVSTQQQVVGFVPSLASTALSGRTTFDQLSAQIRTPWSVSAQQFAGFVPSLASTALSGRTTFDQLSVKITQPWPAALQRWPDWVVH